MRVRKLTNVQRQEDNAGIMEATLTAPFKWKVVKQSNQHNMLSVDSNALLKKCRDMKSQNKAKA